MSFLTNRPQSVKVGSSSSTTRTLSYGCPQGCVSSPLLYILYTNDCTSSSSTCMIEKYADDTALIGLLDHNESDQDYLNEIEIFKTWCNQNKLELNGKKTKEQYFGFKGNYENITPIVINGDDVEIVTNFKYLGVNIDSDLRFETHVEMITKKASQRLFILRKLRSFDVSQRILTQLFKSLVLSVITFAISVWYGSLNAVNKSKLQKIINQASKITNRPEKNAQICYDELSLNKALKIIDDSKHPLNPYFNLLPSGKRYNVEKSRTVKYKSNFIPNTIKLVNENLKSKKS